jgi:serine/threonine protein kinase
MSSRCAVEVGDVSKPFFEKHNEFVAVLEDFALSMDWKLIEDRFTKEACQKVMYNTLEAISKMHALDVMHRDIRLENVQYKESSFFSEDVKLAGFSNAEYYSENAIQDMDDGSEGVHYQRRMHSMSSWEG